MTENQIQTTLTAIFGDGCISFRTDKSKLPVMHFSSINKDYMQFKKEMLGDLSTGNILVSANAKSSYANCKPIYSLHTISHTELLDFKFREDEENLKLMTELGLAMWFYDDGSLHKTKHFYNLNTHSFTKEFQEDVFVPWFKELGIEVRLRPDRKKNGKEYWYLYIPPHKGGKYINELLKKYPIPSMSYKTWSSETISKESKIQEDLKSTALEIVKI